LKKQRFPIRYAGWKGLVLRLFLIPQHWSYVDVRAKDVRVRMAWGFGTHFTRANIAHVSRERPVLLTAGAHGWRGRWLVNGASRPIVAIKLHEPVRGRALVFPIRVCEVQVSVDDADGLVASLG
jgi:hypothetical protein